MSFISQRAVARITASTNFVAIPFLVMFYDIFCLFVSFCLFPRRCALVAQPEDKALDYPHTGSLIFVFVSAVSADSRVIKMDANIRSPSKTSRFRTRALTRRKLKNSRPPAISPSPSVSTPLLSFPFHCSFFYLSFVISASRCHRPKKLFLRLSNVVLDFFYHLRKGII